METKSTERVVATAVHLERTRNGFLPCFGAAFLLLAQATERTDSAGPPAEFETAPPSAADVQFFEAEVRPILEAQCFKCHGPDAQRAKGGLRLLSTASLLRGGERGPALDRDHPEASLFLRAISYEDPDLEMPPRGELPAAERETLAEWITRGAPWPDYGDLEPVEEEEGIDVAAGRERWAFQPVERPEVPTTTSPFVRNPIDAFVFARLEQAGLSPSEMASPRELVRRAYFTLIGLPPTRAEIEAFEADPSDEAWARLVEGLLARPAYGERWARHWLDVVRFAQTNGYERDTEKPFSWRYRDYVIDAFNSDKPYDRFLLEQLAGDELDEVTTESLIATGFYRVGSWDDEPDDAVQAEFDNLDDTLRTITEGMMGITLGCARCHDHKFDPFPQADYYRFLSFLRSIDPYELPKFALDSPMMRMLGTTEADRERWLEQRQEHTEALEAEERAIRDEALARCLTARIDELDPEQRRLLAIPASERTPAERDRLWEVGNAMFGLDDFRSVLDEDEIRALLYLNLERKKLTTSFQGDVPWALVVSDVGDTALPTSILTRGRASSPGDEVEPAFVQVLCASEADAQPGAIAPRDRSGPEEIGPGRPGRGRPSTGRRLALADWIASPAHPLTARVMANRVWLHQWGQGIVGTPNDFGQTGTPPTHPELLDYLATELVDSGWSVKALQRMILTSYTWRMSSRADDPAAVALDPDNALLWRQNMRRLDAEALRDATLVAAGTLEPTSGGRGYFPELSREALSGMSRPGSGWESSSAAERARRSVYTFAKRGMLVPFFVTFDAASANLPTGRRATTTVAPQALTLLNGDFMGRRAEELAQRAFAAAAGNLDRSIELIFELALARAPSEAERTEARGYVAQVAAALRTRELPLAFRPKVPARLDVGYLQQLDAAELLYGPRVDWSYHRGSWVGQYNDTREHHPDRGPFALYAPEFQDGEVRMRLRLADGCSLGSVFVRTRAAGDLAEGLEVVFLPLEGTAELRRHAGPDEAPVRLARGAFDVRTDTEYEIAVLLSGRSVWVTSGGLPILTATDPEPRSGHFGARAVGARLELYEVELSTDGGTHAPRSDRADAAEAGALQALGLVVLNTNEFAYVD